MFFKRIELTGFKSFATKTSIEFLPGVTIIVGPNGCGKSNIFDAIRWVLGEQSARTLRGTKMGDVIFQGSATYKPMGAAQITLVLDNEERRLPLDFSEVSITRRLYRSGESEYLLNKIPCRLRDIQEIFLDTGVGTDTYSIMEQGRVDEIVRSKPEDRRELFEEAAGISKYKMRKAEALRKLERTVQDLTRLADRVAESRTRCISLKRQASKAERYKSLKEQADAIEVKLLAMRLSQVTAKTTEVERAFSAAKDRLAVARAQNDVAQARREELQLQIELADQRLQDLITQKEDQRQYVAECANEVIRLNGRADAEERRTNDIDKQIAEVAVRADEMAVVLADAKTDEARATLRLIELEAEQNVRRAEYDRLRSDSDSARAELQRLRKAIDQSNEKAMRLENERNQLRLLKEQAEAAIENFQRQEEEHQAAVSRVSAEIDEKVKLFEVWQEELKQLQADEAKTRDQATTAAQARDTLRGEYRQVEQRLHEVRSHLAALERLAKDYEGYYGGVKAVMLAADAKQLSGISGVVAELIQSISSEHDLAIEVALGSHVQDIITRTADDAKAAIEFLKSERLGRATFLPLDMIDVPRDDENLQSVLRRPGIVGLASRLVTYDTYIERSVLHLLGRTVVAETLDVALKLERSGARHRYVSLDGQLILPSGAMTGGSRRTSGIITRQREITDLSVEMQRLATQEADFARRIRSREDEIVSAEARRTKLRDQIGEMRLQLGRGETGLAALRESHSQRVAMFADLKSRVEKNQLNSQEYAERLEACTLQLTEAQEQGTACRTELAQMEQALYGRHAETEKLGEHVNQVDQEIMRLRERSSYLRERAESYVSELDSLDRRNSALRGEQVRGREEAKNLREQAARVGKEKAALEEELAGIDAKAQAAAKEKDEAQIAVHAENERAGALMREINEATNLLNEVQAEHVNVQADLRHLRQTAQEKFETPVEELVANAGVIEEEEREELDNELENLRDELRRMGDNINMGALVEYREENERYEFLTAQEQDLIKARESLNETIETADKTSREMFYDAFEKIRQNFIDVYRRLFNGGKADLVLVEPENGDPLLDGGIEIIAQPPGKKLQNISLLSGGEKALTAIALMFGIFMYKPSPFCVMDEIDAPLDDSNVGRFREMLREFSLRTQFLIVTHNKITMGLADTIYGVTMQETGVSSLVSVSFDQLDRVHITA